ncbi:MAG: hypothetical protein GYB65_16440 [Chloroflexi bacterium]|nr:hypothetical protein [Chloroflexota bacterium]
MDSRALIPFRHYVRLYTLHQVETPGEVLLLSLRIETLRYSFLPLAHLPVDAAYHEDPRAGTQLVREAVLPRLQTLLDTDDPFQVLRLAGDRDALWQQYAAERGLPAVPQRIPIVQPPAARPQIPARSPTATRLARFQQALELVRTAADTAAALAAGYQNWQLGREQRKLVETQRALLQDQLHNAIQAQLHGQNRALDHALDTTFVRGYLADHAGDTAYDAVFGDEADDETGQEENA